MIACEGRLNQVALASGQAQSKDIHSLIQIRKVDEEGASPQVVRWI